ncbi:MAG: glycosyltransferase family 4 protein [Treponema sp.]|uniref:glycosyltransferase family 4 protein n=1 Tax=Treponema sp. TaxID=166 RepID=UPI001B6792CF|nr:glycosyltransferase family 4 protein [Treponema sp.]MBP5401685.1 glycosyltransferase family 4 protein [Treponema sp.]MBR5933594.1 glycosyltransferase family 4 protein [Treponema sp.]
MQNRPIYIVSLNGIENAGGVERVSYYFNEILSETYATKIISAPLKKAGKLGLLLNPFLISLKLMFIPEKFVLCNSWHAFLCRADISVHHGTTYGINAHLPETVSFGSKLIAWMEKVSAEKAKNVLSVSKNCSKELIENYKINPEKITLLNNFVDDKIFIPEKKAGTDSVTRILFSGALVDRKGLSELIRLAAYIENKKDYKLLIATNTGFNTEKFKNLKNTEIKIGLNINQMASFYAQGDVLFFPTRYEGFSMSTLEALSCGIPVAGSSFAVTDELINYKFCKRLDNFNPEKVLEHISELKKNWKDKKDEIHEQIKKEFGKEIYRKKLFDYIQKIMNDHDEKQSK